MFSTLGRPAEKARKCTDAARRPGGSAWTVVTCHHEAETRARSLLASGDAAGALQQIEHLGRPTSSLRLLRNVCLALVGRRVEAHLDLAQWARHSCCPMNARLLLALIELEIGHYRRGVDALRANLDQINDPRTVRVMMIACAEHGHQSTAAHWARTLFGLADSWLEPTAELAASATLENSEEIIPAQPPVELVRTLADELFEHQSVIESLVVAALHNLPSRSTLLLGRAIACIVDELDQPCAGYESLAKLAAHAGNEEEARHWTRRGLSEFPTSAPLALLLAQLPPGRVRLHSAPLIRRTGDDNATVRVTYRPGRVEPDLEVAEQKRALDMVIRAHPDWPDVLEARSELTALLSEAA